MKILLLPGLDGTGILFKPFLDCAPSHFKVEPVSLSQKSELTIDHQLRYVSKQIGNEPCVLVAESYSGRIAYEYALKHQGTVKHVVFVASFLESPSYFSNIASKMPEAIFRNRFLLNSVALKLAYRHYQTKELSDLFLYAIDNVEPKVLKARIREVSCMKAPSQKLHVPCTYIQAYHDSLVPTSALNSFKALCPDLRNRVCQGSHFLMQTNPVYVWRVIDELAEY